MNVTWLAALILGWSISLAAAPLQDRQIGFKADIPAGWILSTSNATRRHFTIGTIATASIGAYGFDKVATPGMIEAIRISERFDGWITLFKRTLSADERRRANADDGEIVVYGFNRLEPNNTITKRVVLDYYFTKQSRGTVVSIETLEGDWQSVESGVKYFIKTFMLF